MIPTSVLKNRYDDTTIDRAACLLEEFHGAGIIPRSDDFKPWKIVLDWLCEHCGEVDRSKSGA